MIGNDHISDEFDDQGHRSKIKVIRYKNVIFWCFTHIFTIHLLQNSGLWRHMTSCDVVAWRHMMAWHDVTWRHATTSCHDVTNRPGHILLKNQYHLSVCMALWAWRHFLQLTKRPCQKWVALSRVCTTNGELPTVSICTCACLPGTVYQCKKTVFKTILDWDAGGASTLGHFDFTVYFFFLLFFQDLQYFTGLNNN